MMALAKKIFPFACFLCVLLECGSSKAIQTELPGAYISSIDDQASSLPDTVIEGYPRDTVFLAKVLTPGSFHANEVWDNAGNESWFGVFKRRNKNYLARTLPRIQRVFDAMLDRDSIKAKTGWDVKVPNRDSCVILVGQLNFLKDHDIRLTSLTKAEIYPGENVGFTYLGIQYRIFATGKSRKFKSGELEVWNYRLFLSATKNGKVVTELLTASPNFDSKMISILFSGDIDGDGLLDLIIDTSRHYNGTAPTLYLSKPAKPGHLLIVAGRHYSVGC